MCLKRDKFSMWDAVIGEEISATICLILLDSKGYTKSSPMIVAHSFDIVFNAQTGGLGLGA